MSIFKSIGNKIKSNKFLEAGIGFTIASLSLRAIGFLSAPIFSRLMEPSEYGIYNTYLAYEGILYLIIGIALHSSLQNAKYEFEGEFDKYISSILIITLGNLLAWIAIVNIFVNPIIHLLGFNRTFLNILILHSFGSAVIQILQSRLTIDYNYKKYLLISFINAVMNVIISVVLILTIYSTNKGFARILGNFIPILVIAILIICSFFKKEWPKYSKKYWSFALKFSLPIVPHGISQIILTQFDRIMIQRMIDNTAAGLYGFAYSLSGISVTITNALQSVYIPWFYSQMSLKTDDAYKKIKERSSEYSIVLCVYVSLIILASPELLRIMGPDSYASAKYACVPILMGSFFSTLYNIPIQVEYYYNKTKWVAATTGTVAIINIILNFIFISKFGYIAAAYTTLVSYMLYFGFHYYMSIRIQGSCLFDSKIIMTVITISMTVGILTLYFINNIWIRALIGFLLLGVAFTRIKEFIDGSRNRI